MGQSAGSHPAGRSRPGNDCGKEQCCADRIQCISDARRGTFSFSSAAAKVFPALPGVNRKSEGRFRALPGTKWEYLREERRGPCGYRCFSGRNMLCRYSFPAVFTHLMKQNNPAKRDIL
jgi:hypothetical protein